MDAFAAEANAFLDRWPARSDEQGNRFQWGLGTDDVSIFEEPDRELELAQISAVRAWRAALAEADLAWITGPVAYGGRALPARYQSTFDELARRRTVPGSGPLLIGLGMVAPTILAHGTEGARSRYLRQMHSGELVGCQLFSEPNAGSDLAAVQTTAVRDGGGWRLNGQKVWTSGAHLADIGEILCKTSTGARHRNLTMFVVDMHADGVDVRPLRQMTGGAAFNEVFLTDVWVSDDDRLGEVDEGWTVAITTLMNERSSLGGTAFGGKGIFALDRLVALVQHCSRDDDPVVRQDLAHLVCGLKTATWTRRRFSQRPPGPESSLMKLALCRDQKALAALVSGVIGTALVADSGEWGTFAWAQFVLGQPGYRLGGGTDEVLRSIIAERVLGLPREPTPPNVRAVGAERTTSQ